MITIDIESEAIVEGSPNLPRPVGIAIRWPEGRKIYHAFGHPTENNYTWNEARELVAGIWKEELLTHNGLGFDISVLQHWFKLPPRDPLLTQDTLFMAYLHSPHAQSLALKSLAKLWLNMETTEQEELHSWIVCNVAECRGKKEAGAYISRAPGGMAGKYAMMDVEMTYRLYEYLLPLVATMGEPYARERKLAPILSNLQNTGVICDIDTLEKDTILATNKLHKLDAAVRNRLNAPDLVLSKDKDLAVALKANGFNNFLTTPKGATSVSKPSLERALEKDPVLQKLLKDRSTLETLTGTFMRRWLEIARANNGRIHAQYNQVKNPEGYGTRTGRLSSSNPNFQNVPNDLGTEYPVMKSYLLPEPGHVWSCADFSSQEPRIAANYEDGELLRAYVANPNLDPYVFVMETVGGISRKEAKTILLGLLYSMGASALAEKLECTPDRATALRNVIRSALRGIDLLDKECKKRFQLGLPIKTLGGRLYFCEPDLNGRNWSYKALNTLVQGSAADQTKQAIIYLHEHLEPGERILGTVHDEISVSHPPHRTEAIRRLFHEAANALPIDVPMIMEMKTGETWAEATKK